jgi:hypothetical protein
MYAACCVGATKAYLVQIHDYFVAQSAGQSSNKVSLISMNLPNQHIAVEAADTFSQLWRDLAIGKEVCMNGTCVSCLSAPLRPELCLVVDYFLEPPTQHTSIIT